MTRKEVRNVADLHVIELEEIEICEWHPEIDGKDKPTEVHLMAVPKGESKRRFVLRFKSRQVLDQIVSALRKHADSVFGQRN